MPEPGNPQALNRYAYCLNSPVRYMDPTGRYTYEEDPEDPWVFSDARVRSEFWYTHPESEVGEVSAADIALAFLAPPMAAAAGAAAATVAADVGIQAVSTLLPLAQQLWDRLTAAAAEASPWTLQPLQRGQAIEDMLGRNLPRNFPTIDRFDFNSGIATSIKSLDLKAVTYQNTAALTSRVQGYVDAVANFEGHGVVRGDLIAARELHLVVPAGAGTPSQWTALQAARQYAAQANVALTIAQIP